MAEQAAASGLTLDVKRHSHEIVVRCTGRLVLGTNTVLYDEVGPLAAETKRVVLDFADVSRMDSTGLGTLVRLYVSSKSKGCALELVNMGPSVRHLLGGTQLL